MNKNLWKKKSKKKQTKCVFETFWKRIISNFMWYLTQCSPYLLCKCVNVSITIILFRHLEKIRLWHKSNMGYIYIFVWVWHFLHIKQVNSYSQHMCQISIPVRNTNDIKTKMLGNIFQNPTTSTVNVWILSYSSTLISWIFSQNKLKCKKSFGVSIEIMFSNNHYFRFFIKLNFAI